MLDTGSPGAVVDRQKQPERAAAGAVVEIEYWTDPLCCWSWALEPQWRRLRYAFGPGLRYRYRMGGMIPDWTSYSDPLNAVSRPLQMGPIWFQVRHMSGMPLDEAIWREDPPGSSYLPCVAVKAAERQSPLAAELYLRRLREAVMANRRNISRRDVLLAIAEELGDEHPEAFSAAALEADLGSSDTLDALREDLQQAGYRNIGRFPTLTFRRPGAAQGLILVGYRPYASLHAAVRRVAPELAPVEPIDPESYATAWEGAFPRELEELAAPAGAT